MTHNEAYWFLQLGKHLERAAQTIRVLGLRYGSVHVLEDGTPGATLELIAMLKALSAFEPFRQTPGSELSTARVAEFLLVHQRFPRAVLFGLQSCASSLAEIGDRPGSLGARSDRPRQLLGRLCADLEYLDFDEVTGASMQPFLDGLLRRVHAVGDELARTYFSTRVVMPRGREGSQEQEQQQQ